MHTESPNPLLRTEKRTLFPEKSVEGTSLTRKIHKDEFSGKTVVCVLLSKSPVTKLAGA